jgi:hypothetical protein
VETVHGKKWERIEGRGLKATIKVAQKELTNTRKKFRQPVLEFGSDTRDTDELRIGRYDVVSQERLSERPSILPRNDRIPPQKTIIIDLGNSSNEELLIDRTVINESSRLVLAGSAIMLNDRDVN